MDRGSRRCSDADSRDQLTAELVSDLRRHAPAGATGPLELVRAAPVYVRAKAEGGALCQNDLSDASRGRPAADVPCYRLTVRTDRGQRSVSVRAGGEATIRAGRGAYTSGVRTVQDRAALPADAATSHADHAELPLMGYAVPEDGIRGSVPSCRSRDTSSQGESSRLCSALACTVEVRVLRTMMVSSVRTNKSGPTSERFSSTFSSWQSSPSGANHTANDKIFQKV